MTWWQYLGLGLLCWFGAGCIFAALWAIYRMNQKIDEELDG